MSSKNCITEAAVIAGGLERGAGKEAHHSWGLVSGSVISVFVFVFVLAEENWKEEELFIG